MSEPVEQPGTDPQPAEAEAVPEETDQDSEPPLSAPDGPDGTVDPAGPAA